MTTVVQRYAERRGRPVFLCDFSPPRGADLSTVDQVKQVGADFVCVAYSPGKSVRVDSTVMAHLIGRDGEQQVVFNLACRDMNRLAIQNHLLGAQLLGLENVLVLQGDEFTEKDLESVKRVADYRPVELIRDIVSLNEGIDFRGLKLRQPTAFCIGAVVDLGRADMEREVELARQKVSAGADYLITQAFYDLDQAARFHDLYAKLAGQELPVPVFYGLQVLEADGLIFGDVPEGVRRDLDRGRSGVDIAQEQLRAYIDGGMTGVYLVPPILKGGRRDYQAARSVLDTFLG
ncbi:MAG: methylenetetrahydrofolate reductase [Chloroflexi bacterium]|nr:methylenetetrahydrofolate reductase [Chloroflexota bacterium]